MSAEDYTPAIKALGLRVLAEADLGHYQGDWVAVVKDSESWRNEYGFVAVGYGSCSGCDEWQAAENASERAQVIADVMKDAKWFGSLDEVKAYVAAGEGLSWYEHESDWPAFRAAVAALEEDYA